MSLSHPCATPTRASRSLPRSVLVLLQLLMVTVVATGALVTNAGSAAAQNEPPGGVSQRQLPGVLYRGDSRHPNTIFSQGFTSRGTNYDLVSHVHGDRENVSGYISTTGTQSVAEQFARSQGLTTLIAAASEPRCQGAGWRIAELIPFIGNTILESCEHSAVTARSFVYTIDPNFANIVLHVPDQIRGNHDLYTHYASQDEWAFFRRIPPQAITGVHIYAMTGRAAGQHFQMQSATFRHEIFVRNPNYDPHYRYNPVTDPAAHFSFNTPLNIPPLPANAENRGCSAINQCRGGNG